MAPSKCEASGRPQVRERMTSSVVTIEPSASEEGDRWSIISEADFRADEGLLA